MPSERAYGRRHVQRRAELLAALEPGAKCPKCGKPFERDRRGRWMIDLAHTNPDHKRAGLAGDVLWCWSCNRGEFAVPPHLREKQQQQEVTGETAPGPTVPPGPGCRHRDSLLRKPINPGDCQCSRPWEHYLELAAEAKRAGGTVTVEHPPARCPGCGGFQSGRYW